MSTISEKQVAEKLLQVQAVKLSPAAPFTWASGWKSPIYCDNRKTLSYPYVRDYIKSELSNLVFSTFPDAAVIAGVATAGIPHGALIADQLKLPFIYVRSKPKEHGMGNQIEGVLQPGQQVVVVEDLISTGKSSLEAVQAIRAAGGEVVGMVSIFNYGFDIAVKAFEAAGVPFYSLSNYNALIALAQEKGMVSAEETATLQAWRAAPDQWGR
ncbi:orotate phosphoribosyltransferase [Chitinophaga terrae (ex Kim and Jung 2007)]|uniref:Orotate phosphoribosyltransferase n=1 Tax=Chitinophaga terrae (ex Kim and Jung 2007) TaxID=408074 RepID=A0A1H3X011_9BACT|nr:orotate phosphoribosyltransferase [Chitinophaga terrae (ex Kim and Jung 2007)]MDQ0106998.1 orotate phosphoribosyltransferase [Chitinophaga terrae (ex Kim and Jung 2007)]GEP90244.1 orotate phosphoribosyltransferase [Chitinophaga terrae (ex Kim and Jung 2007)]SDZ92014.1 orotate phosphoribosyltransferase [Chitinophaga terrae (ex Kim and Jung 2007)]